MTVALLVQEDLTALQVSEPTVVVQILTDGLPGAGLPPGGDEGQVATKASDDDYDIEWADAGAASLPPDVVMQDELNAAIEALGSVYDPAGSASTAQAAAITASQPVDSDLTAIAALSTTSFGRGLLTLADAAAGRTALALGTAATQASSAFDPAGTAAAAVAALVASAPGALDTLDEIAAAFGDDANFATTVTDLIATKQPLDSDLTAIAALTTTSYGRAFLALADAAAGRTALGLGNVDNTADASKPVSTAQQTALDLKANLASPTFTGSVTIPGGTITGITDLAVADGGTGASTAAAAAANLAVIPSTGWIPEATLPTYSAGTGTNVVTFAVASDATTRMFGGWRVQFTETTVKYGIITAVTATSITVYLGTLYTSAGGNPTTFAVSPAKAPVGFTPNPVRWTESLADTSSRLQAAAVQSQIYAPGSLALTVPVGVWRLLWEAQCEAAFTTSTIGQGIFELSTSSSAATDPLLRGSVVIGGASGSIRSDVTLHREATVILASPQTYTLICWAPLTAAGNNANIGFRGDIATTVVQAVNAYL